MTILFRREEATRTPDPYVPNVVRYQLRYFSKILGLPKFSRNLVFFGVTRVLFSKAAAKVLLFFDIRKKKRKKKLLCLQKITSCV